MLAPGYLDIAAQVVFAVRAEQAMRVSDFVWRRSLLGFSRDQGAAAWGSIADLMSSELCRSPEWRDDELANCLKFRDQTQRFRTPKA